MNTTFEIGNFPWWAQFGVLGVGALVLLAWAVDYWMIRRQGLKAKQRKDQEFLDAKQSNEVERDRQMARFLSIWNDSQPEELECKRRQTELLERMDKRQEHHSETCEETLKTVNVIYRKLS